MRRAAAWWRAHGIGSTAPPGCLSTMAWALILSTVPPASLLAQERSRPEAQDAAALAEAVARRVTAAGLATSLDSIVQHDRLSGSEGEDRAVDFLVRTLRGDGIPVTVDTFPAYVSDPMSARVEVLAGGAAAESSGGGAPTFAPEALTVSFSGSARGLEGALVDAGTAGDLPEIAVVSGERLLLDCELERETGAPTKPGASSPATAGCDAWERVRGKVVLLTGRPGPEEAWVLERLGARAALVVNREDRLNALVTTTVWGTPSLRDQHRIPTLPVAEVKRSAGERIREMLAAADRRSEPLQVRLDVRVRTGWKPLRLAVAHVPPGEAGGGTGAEQAPGGPGAAQAGAGQPDGGGFVLFGGHIDSWWHGATDEGASNAAMLELARAFWKERDGLRRELRVAWWPGHSNARYAGSTWYADHRYTELRERALAYVNVDGIGQKDADRFSAAADGSLAGFAARVVASETGQEIDPFPPGRNSDHSFVGVGLPALQLYHERPEELGGYWWWHTPDDTRDKIDPAVLEKDADLYARALAGLLAEPVLPLEPAAQVRWLESLLDEVEAEGPPDAGEGAGRGLAVVRERLRALATAVARMERAVSAAAAGGRMSDDVNHARLDVLRPLHRVLYTLQGPHHPDPAVGIPKLPGLRTATAHGGESAGFAATTFLRERNRLVEALDLARERALRLARRLEAGAGS